MVEAGTFATIVGLLNAFSSGRQAQSTAEIADFTQWLVEHNHEELVKLIESNYSTSLSIKSLLNRQSADLQKQLSDLAESTALIASRMLDLDGLASSLLPNLELSEQAVSIIRQMAHSKTEYFLIYSTYDGTTLVPSDGGAIEYPNAQFLKDDLATLAELQLLRQDYTENGTEMFYFTRSAAKLIQNLDGGNAL